MNKDRILITGADGFLGKYLIPVLESRGEKITSSTKEDFDILNRKLLIKRMKGFKQVIHLAGNTRTARYDNAEDHFNINSVGTINILEACRINKISRIILASTVEVYGINNQRGIKLRESDITLPESFYGQSKLLSEHFCREYSRRFGINFTILRFTYLYGHGMYKSRIIPRIIDSIRGKGEASLLFDPKSFADILYVKDAVMAIYKCLGDIKSYGQTFNISSGGKTGIKDIANAILRYYPKSKFKFIKRLENKKSYVYDNSKASKLIGFIPEYNLDAGIRDYITSNNLI